MKQFSIGLLSLLLFISGSCAQKPATTVPAFTFFNADKTSFTNNHLQQGKMLMFIFFDPGCEHCQYAVRYISEHNVEFKKIAIYLISLNGFDTMNFFMDKYGKNLKNKINVRMLQDINNEFIVKFGPKKYPSIFLYSAEKKLIQYEDEVKRLVKIVEKIKEFENK